MGVYYSRGETMGNCCHENDMAHKKKPRSEEEKKDLKKRLNRLLGQLSGIERMIMEDRYCGDILIQISAAEEALKKVASILLKTHMKTCVKDELLAGDEKIIEETIALMEKLK